MINYVATPLKMGLILPALRQGRPSRRSLMRPWSFQNPFFIHEPLLSLCKGQRSSFFQPGMAQYIWLLTVWFVGYRQKEYLWARLSFLPLLFYVGLFQLQQVSFLGTFMKTTSSPTLLKSWHSPIKISKMPLWKCWGLRLLSFSPSLNSVSYTHLRAHET